MAVIFFLSQIREVIEPLIGMGIGRGAPLMVRVCERRRFAVA
jgi:hypothetical protein